MRNFLIAVKEAMKKEMSREYRKPHVEFIKKYSIDESKWFEDRGVITLDIASELNLSVKETRMRLNKLASEGSVYKSQKNAGRYCRWWVAGLSDEIRKGQS